MSYKKFLRIRKLKRGVVLKTAKSLFIFLLLSKDCDSS